MYKYFYEVEKTHFFEEKNTFFMVKTPVFTKNEEKNEKNMKFSREKRTFSRGTDRQNSHFFTKKCKKMSKLSKKMGMLRVAHTKILYCTHSFLTTSRERTSDIASTSCEVLCHAMRYQNSVTFSTTSHSECHRTHKILLATHPARYKYAPSKHLHNASQQRLITFKQYTTHTHCQLLLLPFPTLNF